MDVDVDAAPPPRLSVTTQGSCQRTCNKVSTSLKVVDTRRARITWMAAARVALPSLARRAPRDEDDEEKEKEVEEPEDGVSCLASLLIEMRTGGTEGAGVCEPF